MRRSIEKLRKVTRFHAREKNFRRFVKRSETHPVPRSVRVIASCLSRVKNEMDEEPGTSTINFLKD